MEEVTAIVVCDKCSKIFNSGNMGTPCPSCGGSMYLGMTAISVLDAIDDADALRILMESGSWGIIEEEFEAAGYQYDPGKMNPHRLTQV